MHAYFFAGVTLVVIVSGSPLKSWHSEGLHSVYGDTGDRAIRVPVETAVIEESLCAPTGLCFLQAVASAARGTSFVPW